MRTYLIILIIICCFYFTLFFQNHATYCKEVDLNISINKSTFCVEDKIRVEIEILNNSAKQIRILPWMGPYEYNWFSIIDSSGLKQKIQNKVVFEIDPRYPYKNSYRLVNQRDSYRIVFNGVIIKDETTGRKAIDFPFSRFYLPSDGEYFIRATFESDDFVVKEANDRYNFNDLWQGNIFSNTINFSIKE